MLLIFHIIVAILSIFLSAYAFFSPSWTKLHLSYLLVAFTLLSGTILIIHSPSHLPQTCLEGLVYVGIVTSGILVTRSKLLQGNNS